MEREVWKLKPVWIKHTEAYHTTNIVLCSFFSYALMRVSVAKLNPLIESKCTRNIIFLSKINHYDIILMNCFILMGHIRKLPRYFVISNVMIMHTSYSHLHNTCFWTEMKCRVEVTFLPNCLTNDIFRYGYTSDRYIKVEIFERIK